MPADPSPTRHDLHFELHVALALQPGGLQPTWRAVLRGQAPGAALHFESMPELIRYLARLDAGMPARGIR